MKAKVQRRRSTRASNKNKPKINILHRNDLASKVNKDGTKNYFRRNSKSSKRSTSKNKESRNVTSHHKSGTASSITKSSRQKGYIHNISGPSSASHMLVTSSRATNKLRIARPPQNIQSVSNSHWNQISTQLQSQSGRRPINLFRKGSQKENEDEQELESFIKNIEQHTKESVGAPNPPQTSNYKTFSFLSNLGGRAWNQGFEEQDMLQRKMMNMTARGVLKSQKHKLIRPSSSRPTLRVKQNQMFTRNASQSKLVTPNNEQRRPMSANPKFITISGRNRPLSAQIQMGDKFRGQEESIQSLEEDTNEFHIPEISEVHKFDQTEQQYVQNEQNKISQRIMQSQPTTTSVFQQDRDFNLPYPDLFDRTERTFAACYAKFGNLSYFTAVQRIGCYMDFSARLKRTHLNDIIQFMKNNTEPLEFDDEERDENFNQNCLFIGIMPEEKPENERFSDMLNNGKKMLQFVTDNNEESESLNLMSHVYDPNDFISEFGILNINSAPGASAYSPALLKEIEVSKLRYAHYLKDPDGVRPYEVSKYNKEWMSNSLNLIYPTHLLKDHTVAVKELFQEVLDTYMYSMKKAILDYILRSPAERKRLHILMIPREVPPSSIKIVLQGGYSTKLYKDWHLAKKR